MLQVSRSPLRGTTINGINVTCLFMKDCNVSLKENRGGLSKVPLPTASVRMSACCCIPPGELYQWGGRLRPKALIWVVYKG